MFSILARDPALVSAQEKKAVVQQAGDCSVNITGNNNTTASLVCSGVDPKLAEQVRAILNGTRRSEAATKEISEKLDQILNQMNEEHSAKKQLEEEAERVRRTPPKIAVGLTPAGKGKVNITVVSQNLIPFEYLYDICTKDNVVVARYPMAMSKVYPRADHATVSVPVDIQLDRVKDNYLEFHFMFKSLSFDELHLAGHAGQITVKILDLSGWNFPSADSR
jgi:hypothetical protein